MQIISVKLIKLSVAVASEIQWSTMAMKRCLRGYRVCKGAYGVK